MLGISYLLVSLLLIFVMVQQKSINQLVESKLMIDSSGQYFYSLIATTSDIRSLFRKLSVLPEIARIEIMKKDRIKQNVQKILKELNVGDISSILELDYAGMKVMLAKDIKKEGADLIREYMVRLAGSSNIVLGDVNGVGEDEAKKERKLQRFKSIIYPLIVALLGIFWLVLFIRFDGEVKKVSYLVEQYQRRKNVSMKVFLWSVFLVFPILTIISFCFFTPVFLNSLFVFFPIMIGMALQMIKYSWDS